MAANPPQLEAVATPAPGVVLGAPRWLQATVRFARRKPLGASAGAVILLMGLVALLADLLAPHDPLANDFLAMFQPPGGAYWLGTDAFGRDVLSRIIYGSRTALLVGFTASFSGATVGAIIGVASAYFGGKTDLIVQRFMDIVLSFPIIILALAVVAILGIGTVNVILAITVSMVPRAVMRITEQSGSLRRAASSTSRPVRSSM